MRPNRDARLPAGSRRAAAAAIAAAFLLPGVAGADYPRPEKVDRALAAQDDLARRLYPARPARSPRRPAEDAAAARAEAPNRSDAVIEWLSRWGPVESQEVR
jgi:hypothetical protein